MASDVENQAESDALGREASDVERVVMRDHPRCETCDFREKGSINTGYCNQHSCRGERREADKYGAASYDDFWVAPWFYCAKHKSA